MTKPAKSVVIVVGGPAGTGKTTVSEALGQHFSCPVIEGDLLHPQANVDKMSHGIPLTDEDRWGWLQQLSEEASSKSLEANNESRMAVVSCSMLKKVYRDFIKKSAKSPDSIEFRFVFLYTTFEDLVERVANRKDHFMKADMVKSQFDIMEIPEGDELVINGGEALPVDATNKTREAINKEIIDNLAL
ncbi:glucokinase [Scheffersomyces xylosifermentans]|uniref:glucokinase n=1 Tax=Scheffersomyces xylosifermentans TaxID=1304137 RepID=UPI00315D37B3